MNFKLTSWFNSVIGIIYIILAYSNVKKQKHDLPTSRNFCFLPGPLIRMLLLVFCIYIPNHDGAAKDVRQDQEPLGRHPWDMRSMPQYNSCPTYGSGTHCKTWVFTITRKIYNREMCINFAKIKNVTFERHMGQQTNKRSQLIHISEKNTPADRFLAQTRLIASGKAAVTWTILTHLFRVAGG